jgi:hypothetical protein
MKRTFFSIFVLTMLSLSGIIISGENPEEYGCNCTGSPVTIVVCRPENCPGPAGDLSVQLIDETCNEITGSCTITTSSNCCTVSIDACSNHTFHVNYGSPFGSVCSTASFTPSGNPYTVKINCSCP